MKKSLPIAAALSTICGMAAAAEQPVLTVYTYDSFVSEWGPGPVVEQAFEESCGCDLQFVAAGDGAAVLSRIRLEGERSDADVVLGLDTNLTAAAKASGLFAPHAGIPGNLTLPVEWSDDTFLPYDWGYFAFVYDNAKLANPPASFAELVAGDASIVIEDPRSSTPGLGLLLWVKSVYGDQAAQFWAELAPQIVTVTKGWSEAYGMFLEGEADMVLSYTTSPAYHILAEEDQSKSAAIFDEGQYLQIEVAGKLASTDQPELADQFLAFMTTEAFQAAIPMTNWMYPAALDASTLPEAFANPVADGKSLLVAEGDVEALREEALAEWLDALSQ